jgi:S-DNA-T family DNA segregation ATPase FtsK/SpoIIIE
VVTTRRPGLGAHARRSPRKPSRGGSRRNGSRKPASGAPARRSAPRKRSSRQTLTDSFLAVLGAHRDDLWGIALVTAGVLGAFALYANSLGPTGHSVRHGLGALFGFGRFLLPPALVAAGTAMVTGWPRREPTQHEQARAVLGLALALAAVGGLAELAGGSPSFKASTTRLGGAGGWLGAVVGRPLEDALGAAGTSVLLVAVFVVALVLFTGVSVRDALRAGATLARGIASLVTRPMADTDELADEGDGEDVTAGGAKASGAFAGHGDAEHSGIASEAEDEARAVGKDPDDACEGADADADHADSSLSAKHGADATGADDPRSTSTSGDAPVTSALATSGAGGRQLELDLGMAAGEWRLPPSKLLLRSKPQPLEHSEIASAGSALVAALASHGVETRLVGHTVGPTVTRFELELAPGVKVARVTSLAKDIAYAMASPDVRILAPIPGRSAIGVEVPNRRRQLVTLGDVLTSEEGRQAVHPLEVALGRDIAGRAVMVNLAEMPHLLISGATGAGKSSCINSLVTSILMRATPEEVRLILVDPKRVELGGYNGLPHLLTQVVVDPKKAANALSWAVTEMERRYDLLAEVGMRDITGYNDAVARGELDSLGDSDPGSDRATGDEAHDQEPEDGRYLFVSAPTDEGRSPGGLSEAEPSSEELEEMSGTGDSPEARASRRVSEQRAEMFPQRSHRPLPFILVVVDELNDLMMVAARDVEESVCRIAQMARAVGIHLVLATQRLIGKGDMLLLGASSSVPRRVQGPWVTEGEVRSVVAHWRRQRQPEYLEAVEGPGDPATLGGLVDDEDDELLGAAMELVVRSQLGSTSMLQRKLRVGFSRAGRLMDLLERRGIVGPSEGSKARAVLMTPEELEQLASR